LVASRPEITRLDFTAGVGTPESVAETSDVAGVASLTVAATGVGVESGAGATGGMVGAVVTVTDASPDAPSVAVDSSELAASSSVFFAAVLPAAAAFLGALTGFTSSG
jgi:hypothetical protein